MNITFSWTSWEFWVLAVLFLVAIFRKNGNDRGLWEVEENVKQMGEGLEGIKANVKEIGERQEAIAKEMGERLGERQEAIEEMGEHLGERLHTIEEMGERLEAVEGKLDTTLEYVTEIREAN